MNNLMYLRDTCFQVIQGDMHSGLRDLTSSWLHISYSNSISPENYIRVLHLINIIDQLFNTIFSGNIIYYSTAFIGRVRFTTTDYVRNKVTDDSSIIFKIGSKDNFGRIRRIFTVNNAQPLFYVDVISKMIDFQCETSTDRYSYSNIQTGSLDDEPNSVFINVNDIVQKCVFFERENKLCTFYRFPNLEESS